MNYQMNPNPNGGQMPQTNSSMAQPGLMQNQNQQSPRGANGNSGNQTYSAPNPYQDINTQPIGMATGGHLGEKGHMDYAHFNKNELPSLDAAQGGPTFLPGTNIRHYGELEKRLTSDPEYSKGFHAHFQHLAKGGEIHRIRGEAMNARRNGRFGDTDIAFIGPHTRKVLNHYLFGGPVNPCKNPNTGKDEYFLGSLMSGIGNLAKKGASAAWDYAKKNPDKIIGGIGQFASDVGNKGFGGAMKDYGQQAMNFGRGQMDQARQNPMEAMQRMGNFAQQHFGGEGGMDPNHPIMQMKNRAQEFMNSPMGQNLGRAGRDMYNSYRGGEDMGRMAARGINSFSQGYDNPMAHFAQGATNHYMQSDEEGGGRGNPMRAMASGAGRAMSRSRNPYMQDMGEGMSEYGRSGSGRQGMQQSMGSMMGRQRRQAQPMGYANDAYGEDSYDPSLFD